ncbi:MULTISPECIES: YraN family protein [unclassified Ruminococcus]|uniref:YraN family protein n=1 Tax=unclassified Ruminococcus TaxID=2608920 RepID=UPI00210E8EDB|nr:MULTISPECIES: YraN family protein [unclassified Ruminococcus]MCQ4023129.1 YraN family protein [Ruminococcus sp. zg-924]MCQ4115100.1 YraN family protein [Ruminococcus sp. zg-921]
MTKEEIGHLGEDRAQKYLLKNQYKIADTNFTTNLGEIDIIAVKNNIIAFVEVKTRVEGSLVRPVEAVNRAKINKIIRTAHLYMVRNYVKLQPRFDICEVTYFQQTQQFRVTNYIKNAFQQEGSYAVY